MTRFPTKAEAAEFIETTFNNDAGASYIGRGQYQFSLIGVPFEEVEQDIMAFALDHDIPLDESAFKVVPDSTEYCECITVTIQTGEDA